MKYKVAVAAVLAAALLSPAARPGGSACAQAIDVDPETGWIIHQAPATDPSQAYRWLVIMQEASGRSVDRVGARPTIISREMHVVVTSMYDAWAAYDGKAVGTRYGGELRRPPAEQTERNKEIAVSYAAYRSLLAMYPEDEAWITEQMRGEGYDPSNTSMDPATPEGIGNLAAKAVVQYRLHDGANQLGDEVGSDGKPYSDYTFYEPKNPIDEIIDPDRWQIIPFDDGKGGKIYPGFLTPHWYRVKPFALERADQFRPGPPPKVGSEKLKEQVDECITANGYLTHQEKTIVEFMRDGPRSTGQSGHWLRFAADVSRRDRHDIDQDVKMFFAVGNVVFDAFISCWDTKRYYDSSRPWTLIRYYYGDEDITAYLGPCEGFGTIPANQWHPYSPTTFVTPPFPGYTSGHATASGAGGKILELFTGSDRYEAVALRACGELTETDCTVAEMQARNGVPDPEAPEERLLRLELPSFSHTSEMAARSRMLGGYHISEDNDVGLKIGRELAAWSWPKYEAYFNGTAKIMDPAPKVASMTAKAGAQMK